MGHAAARRPTASRRRWSPGWAHATCWPAEGAAEALAADVGGFDLVLEATGDAQVMASTVGLLGRSGVAVLLGIDGRVRDVSVDGRVLGIDFILGNRAVIASVNARSDDWHAAVAALDGAWDRFGDVVERFVAPARAGRPVRRRARLSRHQGGARVRLIRGEVRQREETCCDRPSPGCGWDHRP